MATETATSWGITIPFDGRPLREHPELFKLLHRAGYTDLWSAEANGADGVTPLAIAAATVPAMNLGTAILPSFTRGPALLAQTAAAMADASDGHFSLGIGSSSNVVVQRWNAIEFDRPYQRTRDVVRFVKRVLAGEQVSEEFETFTVSGFRLAKPPAVAPKVLVAALRPQMLRLAGREGDGVILNWLSAEDVRTVVPYVKEGHPDPSVVARVMVCPSEDAEAVRNMIRPLITGYLTVPVYREYQRWLGREDLLGPVWEAWDAGERKAALAAVPDELIDAFCVHGSPEHCRAELRRYIDCGVTTPVIAAMLLETQRLEDVLEALGPNAH